MSEKELQAVDYNSYSSEQLSELSNQDHREDAKQFGKQENALALVVLGVIALICGVLFLILSVRRVMNESQGIDSSSLQFYVCIACFAVGAIILGYGLFCFLRALIKRTQLKKEIMQISEIRKERMIQEKKEETL